MPNNSTYLRRLLSRAGLSQVAAARELGIDPSTLRRYLAKDTRTAQPVPRVVVLALERLAER